MKAFKIYSIALGGLFLAFWFSSSSCYKGKEGFLADSVIYTPRQVSVIPGRTQTLSPTINGLGSSKPLTLSIHKIYGVADGKDYTEDFLREIEVTEWKENYTKNETTIEEVLAKRHEVKRKLLEMEPVSGKITINEVREEGILPVGDFYIDIKVKNVRGELISPRAIKLTIRAYTTTSVTVPRVAGNITSANVTIKRLGDGNSLTVKVEDSNGNIVPLDSLNYVGSASYAFESFKNFGKEKVNDITTYTVLYPWAQYGTQRIYLERKELVKDPITEVLSREFKYSFDFNFAIIPAGKWQMDIKMH